MGGTSYFIHAGFIVISLANLVVILLLIVFFAAAVTLRWPGNRPNTISERNGEGSPGGAGR